MTPETPSEDHFGFVQPQVHQHHPIQLQQVERRLQVGEELLYQGEEFMGM